jgi:hypothetical protein
LALLSSFSHKSLILMVAWVILCALLLISNKCTRAGCDLQKLGGTTQESLSRLRKNDEPRRLTGKPPQRTPSRCRFAPRVCTLAFEPARSNGRVVFKIQARKSKGVNKIQIDLPRSVKNVSTRSAKTRVTELGILLLTRKHTVRPSHFTSTLFSLLNHTQMCCIQTHQLRR